MEEKKAKKIYTLEEITFNPENLTMSVISCIPFVGLVLMFVEKKDLFVRYHSTQFAFFNLVYVLFIIPFIGPFLVGFLGLILVVIFILGLLKTSRGERFDVPFISPIALKLMGEIDYRMPQ
ncbi:hypothetical protein A3K02_00270 [candidate division WS6 bacterium RIFOXYD1_FULL_33_8]|uniref:Chloroplast import component protein (Tic20) n=1 Tax=candidate division WS6 bacterium GW2011_GWB1_33_6 TaxID=1619088 RepID=A0A0G0ACV0_9BACT|nr:MAG: hypothetical protein UR47_C0019G0004 [candidate division WS6 bacterium GW2011_GWB1_33_6]KKP55663.1 MAG: hypothetical protein UR49_C0035G0003 [candidate division WS6 bacterium GW2011_GWF2_33_92]OGC36287.1 MAG: hypothetical protein A2369_03100 [candidate division WS6 bacterium RIFOXYB1_FULL_33_15]OGC37021.1 MAG: hypothetical protein A2436_02870 [candidate division WS6 bacterium RIFOXYC1_FULL_33_9]OGC42972.1 MAG: hypothetical protein A3K02_00270 [candidate division WS6 bacterium RIFOXYD1_F